VTNSNKARRCGEICVQPFKSCRWHISNRSNRLLLFIASDMAPVICVCYAVLIVLCTLCGILIGLHDKCVTNTKGSLTLHTTSGRIIWSCEDPVICGLLEGLLWGILLPGFLLVLPFAYCTGKMPGRRVDPIKLE